jgi:hypothetical protein
MCTDKEFCPKADLATKQLILIAHNGASEVIEIDPKNPILQEKYAALITTGMVEIAKIGKGPLWVRKNLFRWIHEKHARPTLAGYAKLITPTESIDEEAEPDE